MSSLWPRQRACLAAMGDALRRGVRACDVRDGRTALGGIACGDRTEPQWRWADKLVKQCAGTFPGRDGFDVPLWRALRADARHWREAPPSWLVDKLRARGITALPEGTTKLGAQAMLELAMQRR